MTATAVTPDADVPDIDDETADRIAEAVLAVLAQLDGGAR